VLDGISVEGRGNDVKGNSITRSDESGIFIAGDATASRTTGSPRRRSGC
jgi:hypothetical protein